MRISGGVLELLGSPGLVKRICLFSAGGAALYLVAIVWAGWHGVIETLGHIGVPWMLLGAVLASSAYLVRFWRWQYSLRIFEYVLPWRRHLEIYLAGLALTTSPGKLGETIRSLLLRPWGVRVSHSLGAFVADRLSDVLGVCLLGLVASVLAGRLSWALLAGLCGVAAMAMWGRELLLRHAALVKRVLGGPRLRWLGFAPDALAAWAQLWRPSRAGLFSLLACCAYGIQACVFFLFCTRAGLSVTPAEAIAIFSFATLFGAASMVPGGLGAMEAALVVQLVALGGSEVEAVSVAIAVRLVTLWLGVAIGILAALGASRKMVAV